MPAETSSDRLFAKLVEEVTGQFRAEPAAATAQAVFNQAVAAVDRKQFWMVQSLLPRTRQVSLSRMQGVSLLADGIDNGEVGYRRVLAATVAATVLERLQAYRS